MVGKYTVVLYMIVLLMIVPYHVFWACGQPAIDQL